MISLNPICSNNPAQRENIFLSMLCIAFLFQHHKQLARDRWHKIIPQAVHVLMQDDELKVPNSSPSSTLEQKSTRTSEEQTYKS